MSVTLRLRRNQARLSTSPRAGSPPGVRLLGRRVRIAMSALALGAVIGLGAGASPSLAVTGSVYWDGDNNVGVGETPLQRKLHRVPQRRRRPLGDAQPDQRRPATSGSGIRALEANTSGSYNVAIGGGALALQHHRLQQRRQRRRARSLSNTTGYDNIAIGRHRAPSNTTGNDNVAAGTDALHENTTGSRNMATGTSALYGNTTGNDNVASGYQGARSSTPPAPTTSRPARARCSPTPSGHDNLAAGFNALNANTTGINNVAARKQRPAGEHDRERQRRHGQKRARPEHDRPRQHRERLPGAAPEHDRVGKPRARLGRRSEPDHGL